MQQMCSIRHPAGFTMGAKRPSRVDGSRWHATPVPVPRAIEKIATSIGTIDRVGRGAGEHDGRVRGEAFVPVSAGSCDALLDAAGERPSPIAAMRCSGSTSVAATASSGAGRGAVNYRGRFADWRQFLGSFLHDHGVTDIVLFGDCRPYHRVALDLARSRGIATPHLRGRLFPSRVDHAGARGARTAIRACRATPRRSSPRPRASRRMRRRSVVSGGISRRVRWEILNQIATMAARAASIRTIAGTARTIRWWRCAAG